MKHADQSSINIYSIINDLNIDLKRLLQLNQCLSH